MCCFLSRKNHPATTPKLSLKPHEGLFLRCFVCGTTLSYTNPSLRSSSSRRWGGKNSQSYSENSQSPRWQHPAAFAISQSRQEWEEEGSDEESFTSARAHDIFPSARRRIRDSYLICIHRLCVSSARSDVTGLLTRWGGEEWRIDLTLAFNDGFESLVLNCLLQIFHRWLRLCSSYT